MFPKRKNVIHTNKLITQTIRWRKTKQHVICEICLKPFKPNQKVVILECFHMFHRFDLQEWFTIAHKCPIC